MTQFYIIFLMSKTNPMLISFDAVMFFYASDLGSYQSRLIDWIYISIMYRALYKEL